MYGSKMEGVKGEVAGGWFEEEGTNTGGVPVGPKARVWDAEIAGIEGALAMVGKVPVLILADSKAALQVIKVAVAREKSWTKGLMEVVRLISEIESECGEKSVTLAWVKAHVRMGGNKEADAAAKGSTSGGRGRAETK